MFLMALCTSSLDADTPRCAYLFEVSELIFLVVCMLGKDSFNVTIIQLYTESISMTMAMAISIANSMKNKNLQTLNFKP